MTAGDFSLQLLPGQPLAELIGVIRLADELGFRGCYSVRPVVEAFGRGDAGRALELTTPDIGERLSIAGEPAEWIERLRSDFAPHGYDHVAPGLVDPSLVESWSGWRIDGVPDLAAQPELFAAEIGPALAHG